MRGRRKRNALLALAALLAAGGVTVGILTAGGGHARRAGASEALTSPTGRGRGQTLVAADYLGISRQQLRRRMRSGRTLAQLADATPGRSAAGLLKTLLAAKMARLRASTERLSPARQRRRLVRLRRQLARRINKLPGYFDLPASAAYLGIGATRLSAELGSGRSLAQIADATPGRSAAGLIAARMSTRRGALERALAAGRISRSSERALLSAARRRITREVRRTPGR